MLRDLIEKAWKWDAWKWDLVPKPASLWWTSAFEPEERCDLSIVTKWRSHKFPFEEKFKILGVP